MWIMLQVIYLINSFHPQAYPVCGGASSRPAARCGRHCGRAGRGWRRHRSDRRTRHDATIAERLLLRIRVIDAVHPLFGQSLEVSPRGLIRRVGWIRVVLPDGRHRWVPQKATDLDVSACEARPNRDLPLVSVRTLIPFAEYVRARLSALDHAHSVWCFLHELDKRLGTRGLGAWYDIHARK